MIESPLRYLPDDLLRKLEEVRRYLERTGGSIQQRNRDGMYYLRIRVDDPDRGRVHRRIKLGDDGAAYAVQTVIDAWRLKYDARKAEEERQREEGRAYDAKVEELRRALLATAGGSSQRRRLAREFDKAAENPWTLHCYLVSGSYMLRGLPPGRKPRGGLC